MVNVRVPGVSIKACNQYSKCIASCKTSLLLSVHALIVYKLDLWWKETTMTASIYKVNLITCSYSGHIGR